MTLVPCSLRGGPLRPRGRRLVHNPRANAELPAGPGWDPAAAGTLSVRGQSIPYREQHKARRGLRAQNAGWLRSQAAGTAAVPQPCAEPTGLQASGQRLPGAGSKAEGCEYALPSFGSAGRRGARGVPPAPGAAPSGSQSPPVAAAPQLPAPLPISPLCVAGVARILACEAGVTDIVLLQAALLHDTVEHTDTSPAELEERFGAEVRGLVQEVTDDKALPKAERKRLQVERAPGSSPRAKLLQLADKPHKPGGTGPAPGAGAE
ncbi:PREDICTED: guanosine-3',5'-bis(diphosphate) 3'-pyrophosphohydrolase MESH1 [Nipponia nippon]|uniref:guanosine-3',5'-bis(diphosphate) 3'-pyrophosphohydrolase MESH1 n=1 Tax=Nipponia nippon TaxID=128390 RepID=UPI0005110DD3|nr:PREDICTED: guanosine-3',5'-bis(diphosphate) 3'-pyrophosphohydrolase MESH1 [Nipponia nippon]